MTTSPKEESTVEYRRANSDDADGIFAILQEVAPEIPLSLDTPESQEVMQGIIAECCACRESWVAVDADSAIIGVALAKPDRIERLFHKNEALSLRYAECPAAGVGRESFAALWKN